MRLPKECLRSPKVTSTEVYECLILNPWYDLNTTNTTNTILLFGDVT